MAHINFRQEQGQSLVEGGLIFPALLLLAMIVLDLGRGLQAYTVLQNSAREAAMYGSWHATDTSGMLQEAKNQVTLDGLDATKLTCTMTGTTSGSTLTVSCTYPFPLMTTVVLGGGSISLGASAQILIM